MSALENVKLAIIEGCLNEAQVKHLMDAYNEDSASATNWLIAVMKLIKSRLESSSSITISHNGKSLILETPQQLADWIEEIFPEIARDCR